MSPKEDANNQNDSGADKDANNQNDSGSDTNQNQDNAKDGGTQDQKIDETLVKAVLDKITPTIAEELGKVFESKMDSRISKLTTTLYKKLGVKDGDDGNGTSQKAGNEQSQKENGMILTSVKTLARSDVREALSLTDPEKEIVNTLIEYEMKTVDTGADDFNIEVSAQAVSEKVKDIFLKAKKLFQEQKVDLLKKSGQLKDIPQPGTQTTDTKASEEYGAEIAKRRHTKV